MNFVIHIGVPKSGTTSLQENVFANLSDVLNIGRPEHLSEEYVKVYNALAYDENQNSTIKLCNNYIREKQIIGKGKTMVWSDEKLLSIPLVYPLAQIFSELHQKPKILIVLRNQYDVIRSYYTNHGRELKNVPSPYQGGFVEFDSFLLNFLSPKSYLSKQYDYGLIYEIFAHKIGEENVHILLYEDLRENTKKFSEDLSLILDVDSNELAALLSLKPKKSSISQKQLNYQRFRKKIAPNISFSRFIPFFEFLKSNHEKYLQSGNKANISLSPQQKVLIHNRYATKNLELANRLGINLKRHGYPM